MTESTTEARLLALIEGRLTGAERERLLREVAASPDLQRQLEQAERGHQALAGLLQTRSGPSTPQDVKGESVPGSESKPADGASIPLIRRRVALGWVVGAIAATLAAAVPATLAWSTAERDVDRPAAAQNEFLVVLHGEWPDMTELTAELRQARRGEYWEWAQELNAANALIGAGELAPEPGTRLAGGGVSFTTGGALERNREFVVGMFVVRAPNYEAAVALAHSSPHVRYGGSVTIRAFNTVVGF